MIQVMERIASFLEEKDLYSLLPKIKSDLGSFPLFLKAFKLSPPLEKHLPLSFQRKLGWKYTSMP